MSLIKKLFVNQPVFNTLEEWEDYMDWIEKHNYTYLESFKNRLIRKFRREYKKLNKQSKPAE